MANMASLEQDIAKTRTLTSVETCSFCAEFLEEGHSSRIIYQDRNWVLAPTIGCFTVGYCLLIPRRHIRSMAELSQEGLEAARLNLQRFRKVIEKHCGPAILAEHGASASTNGAACCEHAHMHIIPVRFTEAVRFTYISRLGLPTRLNSIGELKDLKGKAYLYLSSQEDEHFIWTEADSTRRQFARRVAAAAIGRPTEYDWRTFPFNREMKKTKELLTPLLAA